MARGKVSPADAKAMAGKQVPQVSKVSKAKSSSQTSGGKAQTMDELLAKTGYQIHGFSQGQKVTGKVLEIGPKVLVLDIGAKSEGLVAEREFDLARHFILGLKVGDTVEAQVVVPEQKGQMLLSLRDTAENYAWKRLEELLAKGGEVEVKCEGLLKGGLGVGAFSLKGFIPTSHLGTALAKNPALAVGKTFKVKVIELDRVKNRIIFSERAVSEKDAILAQEKALEGIKAGERFRGRVVGLVSFGAFVQVEKDGVPLDGLVHLSELSWQKVSSPSEVVKVGDEVDVVVVGKDNLKTQERGRLALSIKQAQEDPWAKVEEKYRQDARVQGTVRRLGDFGAIVELEPGVEGLVHLSKIPAGISLKEGAGVECFIEKVEKKNRKISLGLVLKEKPVGYK